MPDNLQPSTSAVSLHSAAAVASPLSAITEEEYLSISEEENENVGLNHPITQEANGQQQVGAVAGAEQQQIGNSVSSAIHLGNKPKTRQSVSKRYNLLQLHQMT